ncbi:MAG TPA: TonB-dependent receptor plug domain-containing protein, partial [Chryseosolibacter sp.]|nr:TonB-dependent receptor plug domain-containing protein [Chryseosolibacter sp.]
MNLTFPRQRILQLWKYVAVGVWIQCLLVSALLADTGGSQTPYTVANINRISVGRGAQNGLSMQVQNPTSAFADRDEWSTNIHTTATDAVADSRMHRPLSVSALAIDVGGTVKDDKGLGIPGVNVLVKGTTTGTVTDVNGVFNLQVENENSVLVFSSIGFVSQEIIVGNRRTIDVTMEPDITQLNEVVVVGYGTQKREDLTGAIASVSGEDLKKVFITTPDQAMQGRVAGVQVRTTSHEPGGGISVQVRGTSSLSASSQPLYVIDGFPISNDYESVAAEKGATVPNQLNSIDPTTIESIEILKDASATAIYGSRATNGVVLITTKRGKSGPARVDYSSSVSFEKVAKKYDLLN